ncbi:MAG: LPS export ABC transporter permease LptF [Deltaproteobacteria bacterium]|nr:LPS export ABC transporter permease LptF [Deltaproteobacteria bacterium]
MPRLLSRYLLAEILHPFAAGLLGFTLIVFSGRVMRLTELIVVKGVGLGDIFKACLYLLPYLLVFTLPMAATVGIILALIRLSVDYEILAMKAAGLSFGQFLRPILVFSLTVGFVTLLLTVYGAPWGRRQTRQLLTEVVKRRADLGIQEQTFNRDFPGLMIYVHEVKGAAGELMGVFVYDKRDRENPHTVYARRGKLHYDPCGEILLLNLTEGLVIRWSRDRSRQQTVEFKSYQLPLRLFAAARQEGKSERGMTLAEIRRALQRTAPGTEPRNRLLVELNQRFAMPLGALLLCLLAVPLGLSPQQHGRVWGLIMGLSIFLLYYVVFTASWRLAVRGEINPAWAPWLPDLLFAGLTAYFWHRTARELPLLPFAKPFYSRLAYWKKRS